MDFAFSSGTGQLKEQVEAFFAAKILPRAREWRLHHVHGGKGDPPFLAGLQAEAQEQGLWNLAIPNLPDDAPGMRLSNMAFAPLAEVMGRVMGASQVFNCHPPEVPNMITLADACTPEQRVRWLDPLLAGERSSAFAMTEPDVASSDATNIATRIERTSAGYRITGRKWYISGGGSCDFFLVMGVTDPDGPRGRQHSVVLVEADMPGVRRIRPLPYLGFTEAGAPAWEIAFEGAEVPAENLLGAEGDGFRLGQVRLGPARIHHCMRAIGHCETLLGLMLLRARERRTFGRDVIDYDDVQQAVAHSRIEIEQSRLLTQKTAWLLDQEGPRAARREVSMIKVAVARAYQNVADRALQIFGAMGGSDDTPIADAFSWARAFRLFDGPDEVHLRQIFRLEPQPEGTLADSPHILQPRE